MIVPVWKLVSHLPLTESALVGLPTIVVVVTVPNCCEVAFSVIVTIGAVGRIVPCSGP